MSDSAWETHDDLQQVRGRAGAEGVAGRLRQPRRLLLPPGSILLSLLRDKDKRTIEDIIQVGSDLLAAKEALPHGQFGLWMRAEFGWTERTARNFMAVSEGFGAKREIISELKIAPTAAYLLAAPSAPDEARQAAIERAEEGEQITTAVAKEILAKARKKGSRKGKTMTGEKLTSRLVKVLSRFKEQWDPKEVPELARQLREFADSLEGKRGREKKAKG